MTKTIISCLFLILLSCSIYIIRNELESKRSSSLPIGGVSLFTSEVNWKALSLNHELTLADILWLKAIQNYLGRFLNELQTRVFYQYLDTILMLDPKFKIVYMLGGLSLSVFCYNGELSNRVFFRAYEQFPDDWRIPFLMGYNYFYEMGDFINGARYIHLASKKPGAPQWLSYLAVNLYSTGGDINSAMEILTRLYELTTDKKMKMAIKEKMKAAIMERDIQELEKGIKKFKERFGKMPQKLSDLVEYGIIKSIPLDPFGGHYLDKENRIQSTSSRARLKIFFPPSLRLKSK